MTGQGQTELGAPMKILFHGRLAEAIGAELDMESVAGCSIGQLRRRLAGEYPAAAPTLESRRAVACVGGVIVADDHVVEGADRVEFLPPVSGG